MANEYYTHGGAPGQSAGLSSATIRGEFDSVMAGFALLPTIAGNANKLLAINAGGTGLTSISLTVGALLFGGASGIYAQDGANLFWDNTNKRLGIGNAVPGVSLDVTGVIRSSAGLTVTAGGITVTGASTVTGTLGGITTLTATTLAGTLSTAAQPNVTSLGTLSALSIAGALTLTPAAAQIVGGATSLSLRNNANNADNLLVADAGTIGVRNAVNLVQGADIASAATVNLDTATGNYVQITGTTTITAITLSQGRVRRVKFTGALTLTNGASLVLPGSVNYTTAAGDTAEFVGEAAGVVRCLRYTIAAAGPLQPMNQQVFTAAGANTWNKPTGLPATAVALIECWGAGGGGAQGASFGPGGAGGQYSYRWILVSALGATETATVGAGGAGSVGVGNGAAGGATTFGAWVTAIGGGGGTATFGGSSGMFLAGDMPEGKGGTSGSTAGGPGFYIGGGGGYSSAGGNSTFGGGGGGGSSGAGGTSRNGGNGGAANNAVGNGVAGTQPGGGGGGAITSGNGGNGGAGQITVTVFR